MADVTECRPKSSSTAHLAGGRLVVQEQLFLEFLDSVQPVWWPRTQADFWAEMWLWGWGAVSSLVGPSSCSEAAGPRSLSEKELSASPPHPGLSQAPLSSPPQPSHHFTFSLYLAFLVSTYKLYHTVFVFICLAYCIKHCNLKIN